MFHRWTYGGTLAEHRPVTASNCGKGHRDGKRHIEINVVRFCYHCQRLEQLLDFGEWKPWAELNEGADVDWSRPSWSVARKAAMGVGGGQHIEGVA